MTESAAAAPKTPHVRHFHDLKFTAVAMNFEGYVEFAVYDIEGYLNDDQAKPCWPRMGAKSSPDSVEDLGEADIYLHGSVKWDGCSNWYFNEQDRVMLHGCSREDIQRFGDVMGRCWDWAAEYMPGILD